ncbi:hypothetical protein MBLNU459_g8531t1 [Dothideomycetes sp. NU459]
MTGHNKTVPRIILHGGAGNISRKNLPPDSYRAYRVALLSVLQSASTLLSEPDATALDVATHAVSLLEDIPLFNAGHGAVYTQNGRHELEASVMCSQGHRKRGVGVMMLNRVRNPIKLAREMLIRGDDEDGRGGGAAGHCQLAGDTAESLAAAWGLEMVPPSYYWTKKRWDEHRRGLGKGTDEETYRKHRKEADGGGHCSEGRPAAVEMRLAYDDPSWNGEEYLPQGTVGCVVLDSSGTLCVATSTGGLTNKLDGRIGDTPTIGAGYFAEQWYDEIPSRPAPMSYQQPNGSPASRMFRGDLSSILGDCLPSFSPYTLVTAEDSDEKDDASVKASSDRRAVAMSGTGIYAGNGDSFLKLSAVRTAAAMTRFSYPPRPLAEAVSIVAGPKGQLQQSADDRWGKTGEGEGGIIGIDYRLGKGKIVADFNCGGMFRAWIDDEGEERMMVFREEYKQ